MIDKKRLKPKHYLVGTGGFTGIVFSIVHPETAFRMIGGAWETDFVRMTVSFLAALFVVRHFMKKDLEEIIDRVTQAINNVAENLGRDLSIQGTRLTSVESGVGQLNTRVSALEGKG